MQSFLVVPNVYSTAILRCSMNPFWCSGSAKDQSLEPWVRTDSPYHWAVLWFSLGLGVYVGDALVHDVFLDDEQHAGHIISIAEKFM